MATSGTVGATRFTTRKVIDNAYGGCKIARQEITAERIEIAKDLLFLRLSAVANLGIPLWTIEKEILPIYVNTVYVPCPVGTVDVLQLNLRRINRLEGTASSSAGTAENAFDGDFETECVTLANGYIQLQLEEETFVPMFGILPGASGTWSFTMQGSTDGVTFTTFYTATDEAVTDLEWFWFDVDGMQEWSYFRLQATGGTVLNVAELVLANNPNEINMALINLDNYATLPNKVTTGQPTQYWLDKQRVQQIINLWPAPGEIARFWNLVARIHRQIQDVGTMVQEIEVRQSWYKALVDNLAYDISMVDKDVKPEIIPLIAARADRSWKDALDGESDSAPSQLLPNIRPYTR